MLLSIDHVRDRPSSIVGNCEVPARSHTATVAVCLLDKLAASLSMLDCGQVQLMCAQVAHPHQPEISISIDAKKQSTACSPELHQPNLSRPQHHYGDDVAGPICRDGNAQRRQVVSDVRTGRGTLNPDRLEVTEWKHKARSTHFVQHHVQIQAQICAARWLTCVAIAPLTPFL